MPFIFLNICHKPLFLLIVYDARFILVVITWLYLFPCPEPTQHVVLLARASNPSMGNGATHKELPQHTHRERERGRGTRKIEEDEEKERKMEKKRGKSK